VVVSWTAVSDSVGIDSYAVEVSRTPAFTALAYADTLDGAATSDTPVLADNDSYHVRVRAIDHLGNAGTYSAARGFMTDTRVGQVVLAFPSDGHETTSSRVVVGWTAVSDSVGIDSYAIEVSRTPAFTALAYADTLDGAVTSDTPALADNDSYHVRVRAIDHLGNAGTYSAARGFVMDTRVGRVVLDTPADKTVTPDSTPTLAWNAVSDSVGIDSYVLEVSASPTFSAMAFVDTVDGSRTSDTTAILADSTYYWRVRAIDELGNVGQNSDSFQIEIDTERVTVTLIAPPNGFQTISETVSFQWSSNRADTFTWQLSRSAAFDSVLVAFADTSVETFVRIISGEDTFYWRVIARDTTGTFDTAASGFVIDRTPPAPVTAVAPADGHETRQAPVTVTWSAVTVVDTVGIDSYVVEVSRSAAFTTTVRVDTVDAAVTADTLFGLENDTYYWRVHAVDHLGNIGVSANTLRFTTDTQVDTVTLDTPLNGATLTNPSPTLNWRAMADSVGIANYALEVSGDSAFTSTVFADTVAGTGTSGAVGVALAADSYFWRVRAIDRVGNIGLNSASFEFRVDTGVSVTLVSPPSGHETTATSITFVWSTADDAETYTWQLSRSAAFTAISDSVVDTSATSVTKSLTAEDTYYWRVTGSDRIGNFDTRTGGFVIDTHAGQVSLASPADGHETTNAALSLQLTALSDSVGIDSYVFEVSKSAVFAATIFSDTVDGALTSDTATGLYNDTYYWRARAIDRLGNAGQVSASRGFLVDTAVETVALIAPSAGHETSNAKVVVTWAAVTADSVGIDSYALEVSRAAAFTSLVFADTVDAALTSDTITGLDNDTFYWRVRAVDFLGNAGLNSAARGFLIDTAAGQITLSAPADGSATRDTTPTFSWSINSDSVGIDSFVLEVSANSTFTNLKFVDTVDGAVTSDTALPFLAEDTYYWRVIAVDNLGNTAAPASAFRFIVDTTVPSRFNLESPVDGHDTTNLRPQFTWSAAQDSGSGIFGYRLELSRDTTFAVLAQTFDTVTGSLAAALTSTDLASDTYFWRVIAIDVAGNTTASDSIFQISIVPTIASIEWSQTEYKGLTVLAQVRLIDPLANVSVFLKDFAEVTILSDADPVGFSLMFEETEINSGVFTATVGFTGGNSDVSAKKIKVNPGSGVTAKRVQTDGKTVTASARWLPELGVAPTDVTKTRSWPNPANPTLGQPIIFQNLPADPTMTIEIYTLDMKKVRTLYNGNGITASSFGNAAQWDGRNDAGQFVASGVYLYLVRSQFGTVVRRITLIK
ncbi:hypothetical protein HY522_00805, partial [bacterium]|nr:hypothetical protein [bacterium]